MCLGDPDFQWLRIVPHSDDPYASTRFAAFELIQGRAATQAEVLLFSGAVPGVTEQLGPWVVLRGDHWPMSAGTARRLAAALMHAADRLGADAGGGPRDRLPRGRALAYLAMASPLGLTRGSPEWAA